MTSWIPPNVPKDWKFSCNSKRWTSSYHGLEWLVQHFDPHSKLCLNEYRLLLCDGHDSHISAEFIAFTIGNNIEVVLLPPHSSHLLQPLDVAVFGPLKTAISSRLHRLISTGVHRLLKVEWLEHFTPT